MMMGKQSPMMSGKGMPPPSMDSDDEDMGGDDDKSSKLMALQNILSSISDLVGDDMKPDIDKALQAINLGKPDENSDESSPMESDESGMPPKTGLDVTIGMGGKPGMPSKDDEEDEDMPKKGGFLAILSKRMKNK